MVRYEDLCTDLDGQMKALAERLGIGVPAEKWPTLVEAATFARMRERAADAAPDRQGVLKDSAAFFRRGSAGGSREILTPAELDHYHERLAHLIAPDVLAWLSERC